MDRKDEFNLDEFKDLLNDVPDAGDFDLTDSAAADGVVLREPRPSKRNRDEQTYKARRKRRYNFQFSSRGFFHGFIGKSLKK